MRSAAVPLFFFPSFLHGLPRMWPARRRALPLLHQLPKPTPAIANGPGRFVGQAPHKVEPPQPPVQLHPFGTWARLFPGLSATQAPVFSAPGALEAYSVRRPPLPSVVSGPAAPRTVRPLSSIYPLTIQYLPYSCHHLSTKKTTLAEWFFY